MNFANLLSNLQVNDIYHSLWEFNKIAGMLLILNLTFRIR